MSSVFQVPYRSSAANRSPASTPAMIGNPQLPAKPSTTSETAIPGRVDPGAEQRDRSESHLRRESAARTQTARADRPRPSRRSGSWALSLRSSTLADGAHASAPRAGQREEHRLQRAGELLQRRAPPLRGGRAPARTRRARPSDAVIGEPRLRRARSTPRRRAGAAASESASASSLVRSACMDPCASARRRSASPCHATRPARMIEYEWQSASSSPIRWLERITATPSADELAQELRDAGDPRRDRGRSSAHRAAAAAGWRISAAAIPRRWRIPVE